MFLDQSESNATTRGSEEADCLLFDYGWADSTLSNRNSQVSGWLRSAMKMNVAGCRRGKSIGFLIFTSSPLKIPLVLHHFRSTSMLYSGATSCTTSLHRLPHLW